MNVLYEVAIPAEQERVARVQSSIEQCLRASAMAIELHEELARVATSLLALAAGWASAEEGSTIAVRIEASDPSAWAFEVSAEAWRPSGPTFRVQARAGS